MRRGNPNASRAVLEASLALELLCAEQREDHSFRFPDCQPLRPLIDRAAEVLKAAQQRQTSPKAAYITLTCLKELIHKKKSKQFVYKNLAPLRQQVNTAVKFIGRFSITEKDRFECLSWRSRAQRPWLSHPKATSLTAAPKSELILVAAVMRREECYVKEWLEHHFAIGVSTVYLLPNDNQFAREFTRKDPRVRVLCQEPVEASSAHPHAWRPASCNSREATSLLTRQEHRQLIASYLAPRHLLQNANVWMMVLDLDEYLDVSQLPVGLQWRACSGGTRQNRAGSGRELTEGSLSLKLANALGHSQLFSAAMMEGMVLKFSREEDQVSQTTLDEFQPGDFIRTGQSCFEAAAFELTVMDVIHLFSRIGADSLMVHWRVYGPNHVAKNPTCATLQKFRVPAHVGCRHNRAFKHLYRLKPDMIPTIDRSTNAHHFFFEGRNAFASDGTNLSACHAIFNSSARGPGKYRALCHPKPSQGRMAYRWSRCNGLCIHAPEFQTDWRPLFPMLQLKHYMTRSIAEHEAKLEAYERSYDNYSALYAAGVYKNRPDSRWREYVARRRMQLRELDSVAAGNHTRSSCAMEREPVVLADADG